jgi:hypothetical protein
MTPFDALVAGPSVSLNDLEEHLLHKLHIPGLSLWDVKLVVEPSQDEPETHVVVAAYRQDSCSKKGVLICGVLAAGASTCRYDVVSLVPGAPVVKMILRKRC